MVKEGIYKKIGIGSWKEWAIGSLIEIKDDSCSNDKTAYKWRNPITGGNGWGSMPLNIESGGKKTKEWKFVCKFPKDIQEKEAIVVEYKYKNKVSSYKQLINRINYLEKELDRVKSFLVI